MANYVQNRPDAPNFSAKEDKRPIAKFVRKKFLRYYFLAAALILVIGFFITFEGYKPKPAQSENTLSAEQLTSIKKAGEDEENIKIMDKISDSKSSKSFDGTNLFIEDLKLGGGEEAKKGDTVQVDYAGTLLDGTKFDSSYDRNQPFSFTVGAGQVIQGWDEGIPGMKVGGKRRLTIPASMGYGVSGVPGAIPANAALIFEVELLKITPS